MPIETSAERAVFFNSNEFGHVLTLTDRNPAVSINGIFQDDGVSVGGHVQSTDPMFSCDRDTLPGDLTDGELATVSGRSEIFIIRNRNSDGTGLMDIELEVQKDA